MYEKNSSMDNMVEVARFTRPTDAHALASLLQSEGIECYVRNELTSQTLGMIDLGGVRVELLESDVQRALQVMLDNGYEIPREDEQPEEIKTVSGIARQFPFLRRFSPEKQIILLFLLVAVLLAALLFLYPLLVKN